MKEIDIKLLCEAAIIALGLWFAIVLDAGLRGV